MLGVEVDELGHALMKNAEIKASEGFDHERGGLLMEAMTEDMLRQRKEEERRREEMGPTVESYADDPVPQSPKKEPEVRISLRAKGYAEDKKVRVKLVSVTPSSHNFGTDTVLQSTKISKFATAFRHDKPELKDKELSISFEGEQLDPEDTVGDTELAEEISKDYVIVEVHIR